MSDPRDGSVPERQRHPRVGVSRRTVVKSAIIPAIALATHQTHSQTSESTTMAIPDDELPYLSTTAQAALIRNGQLSSEELVAR